MPRRSLSFAPILLVALSSIVPVASQLPKCQAQTLSAPPTTGDVTGGATSAPIGAPGNPSDAGSEAGNPLTRSQDAKFVMPGRTSSDRLPDYREQYNPQSQRFDKPQGPLPLYGYDFFASAREIISARRNALKRILSSGFEQQRPRSVELSRVDLGPDMSATLTDAQKTDLRSRMARGRVTIAEEHKYRSFLFPRYYDATGNPRNPNINPLAAQWLQNQSRMPGSGNSSPAFDNSGTGYGQSGAAGINDTGSFDGAGSTDAGYGSDMSTGRNDTGYGQAGAAGMNDAGGYSGGVSSDLGYGPDMPSSTGDNTSDEAGLASSDIAGATSSPGLGDFGTGATGRRPRNYPGSPDTSSESQAPYPMPNQSGSDTADTDNALRQGPPETPPVSAYTTIADPLATTLQQVIATAPTDYQLSGGDQIILRYSSPLLAERRLRLKLDNAGGVDIPTVGRVVVRGDTVAQAENTIRARMEPFYRNVDVSVELGPLRTISVTVSGESYFPGTYQVSAVATAFNMIYATGGPTQNGSMRTIRVLRRGRTIATIDVYRMLRGGKGGDINLQSGDVIYIPGYVKRVAIRGEVRHPAIFELRDNESLADLLRYAEVKPSGVTQRVLVSTVDPGSARLLKDVNVNDINSARAVPLYDGASVDIFSVRNDIANKVTIAGAVDQPGEYELTQGMTVADLVESARGLLDEAYSEHADLYRYNPDTTLTYIPINLNKALARDPSANIRLQKWDKLRVYARSEVSFIGRRDVTLRGAVRHPGIYYRSDNLRVRDLLMQGGGTMPDAYTHRAVLVHQHPDGSYAYQFIDLDAALKDDATQNVALQDHDVLAVYNNSEAHFVPKHTISIQGEVIAPSDDYPRGDGMRLSDALKLAGGPTPKAGDQIQIAHARQERGVEPINIAYSPQNGTLSDDPKLQDGDVITVPGRGSFQDRPFVVMVKGAVNRPGPVILTDSHTRLTEAIKQAGGLQSTAYPQGADLFRNPNLLESDQQLQLTKLVTQVNAILNNSEYKRALAVSDLERIKALGAAKTQGAAAIPIPGAAAPAPEQAQVTPTEEQTVLGRDLVSPPRVLTNADLESNGNIAINLADALSRPNSAADITLKDGDVITIPERPTTVEVVGAVFRPEGIVYQPNASIQYYIDRAGGYAPDAAKDRIIIIHAGGGLIPANKVHSLQPGDVILVPTGVLAAKIRDHASEFDNIFKSITSTTVTVLLAAKLFGL